MRGEARLRRLEQQAPPLRPWPVLMFAVEPTAAAIAAFREGRGLGVEQPVILLPANGRD